MFIFLRKSLGTASFPCHHDHRGMYKDYVFPTWSIMGGFVLVGSLIISTRGCYIHVRTDMCEFIPALWHVHIYVIYKPWPRGVYVRYRPAVRNYL